MKAIIDQWLHSFADSALQGDLEAHMAHISQDVQVIGVAGFDALGFDDWRQQCAHEFPERLILELDYRDLKLRSEGSSQVMFLVDEHMLTRDGQRMQQALEMLLQKEQGAWRLRQLRLLPENEAQHYRRG